MDTVTQVALGATIGEAGFRHRVGPKAVFVGGFCGLLPDLDMVAGVAGPWASLVYHRGSSHSLLVLPLIALGLGWAGWRWARREGSPWTWIHLCMWALLTHPLLDWCTSYGTQLLAPVQRTRFAIDAVAVVDPLYSLPLFAAVLLAARRKTARRFSRRFSTLALAVTTAYLALGYIESQRAVGMAQRQLAREGFTPVALRATPTMFNNQVFRLVARDAEGDMRIGHVSMVSPGPIAFTALEQPDHPLVERALASEHGELFRWFADGYVHARVEHDGDGGPRVLLSDQRYGLVTKPTRSFFHARAVFARGGRLVRVERVDREVDRDVMTELAAVWSMMTGEVVETHTPY